MQITLDPTHTDYTSLEIQSLPPQTSGGVTHRFPHAKRDCSSALVRKLSALNINKNDELRVVLGPGNFTAVRSACLVGNAVKFLTQCSVLAKKKEDASFRKVNLLQPFYASEPAISTPKKL